MVHEGLLTCYNDVLSNFWGLNNVLYCWLLSILSQNHRYTSRWNGAKLCHYQGDEVLWHGIIYQVQQICTYKTTMGMLNLMDTSVVTLSTIKAARASNTML